MKELYLCDDAGNLLVSRCTDNDCKLCAWPRKDDYGCDDLHLLLLPCTVLTRHCMHCRYKGPMNQPQEKIGCKDDFLKVCIDPLIANLTVT
jgi:hypothetical protein